MTESLTIRELSRENERVIKLKNIVAFLQILFGETDMVREILDMSPDYIIEKYDQYMSSENQEYKWGMHANLREELFNEYLERWGLKYDN